MKKPYNPPVLLDQGSTLDLTLQDVVANDEGNGIPDRMLNL